MCLPKLRMVLEREGPDIEKQGKNKKNTTPIPGRNNFNTKQHHNPKMITASRSIPSAKPQTSRIPRIMGTCQFCMTWLSHEPR